MVLYQVFGTPFLGLSHLRFLFLLQHALPPFSLAIDNLTVIKGLRRGEAYCTLPRRPHADLWRRIWFLLRDMGAVGPMRVFFSRGGLPL